MKRFILGSWMMLSSVAGAQQNTQIDIAVVFAADISLSTAQKIDWVADTFSALNSVYDDVSFRVKNNLTNVPVSTQSRTSSQVLTAMQSDSVVNAIRDGGDGGADLVLMIASDTLSSDCGRAGIAMPGGTPLCQDNCRLI